MTKEVIWTDRLMVPIAHFSHAVRVGDEIHVGATAGTDAARRLAGSSPGRVDAAAQAEKMFDNLEIALGLLGAGLKDVVRLRTYAADPRDIAVYRGIYRQRFSNIQPCHAVVGSWDFPLPQAAIELDAVAVVGRETARLTALPFVDEGCPQAGVRIGTTHYGTALPFGHDGKLAAGDPTAQARQTLENLITILAAVGLSAREVVNLRVTLADIRDFAAFEAAFQAVFAPPFPSRAVVGAPLQEPEMLVQIESIALAGGGQPIEDPSRPNALGCASAAMIAGDVLYLSAHTGLAADQAATAEPEVQAKAAWMRLHQLVEQAEFPPESVLRTNNVLTDWRAYAGFNAGYGSSVSAPYPPRTTVLGQLVDPRARLQIEGVAHRRGHQATAVQAVGFK
jgi:enamine deaminase RidA (YjgF/YER057c/UK114 family)